MALVVNDRVQQTGTANTTVSFTLTGTVVGYQSFAVIGNGNTTFYAATDVSGNWEVGVGTYATSGPTLTRTTILSSSNSGSAVTFSGTVNVFVTYPSEQSVNLDASGNVTALGTITSGVWNGSTLPVAYGGTGVTASSGANSVVLRDANQNIYANSVTQELDVVTSAAGTTVLTAASSHFQILIGSTTQTFQLPDATTLPTGSSWIFDNDSTGNLFVVNAASGAVDTVAPGGYATVFLELNGTTAGTWGRFGMIPSEVNWGTNSLDMGGSTVITNGIWQGTPIASGYGGTGLTTFTGANNALYSTGSTTLTAGTLPVAAGGTGATTLTTNGVVYGNGTSPAGITAAGTTGQVLVATTSGAPSWGSVPAGSITGTLPIANGGTGQTTAAAAFNALSPITTTGDLIVGNGTNSATRLGIGSTGQVLTVSGGTSVWSTPTTGGGTITRTDFTATGGQTVFTVSYTVGLIDVYQNGAKLAQADFTATNGTSITLATGATAGDLIQAEVFSSLNLYSTITSETFNGTGSQTVFTMSSVPANAASLLVAISGVVQDPTTYTVSSNTLTFSTAPPSASGNISVRYLGIASVGTVGSFSGGTTGLTPASATTGAVVLGGTLATTNGGTGLTTVGTNGQVLTSNGTTLSYQTPATTAPGGSTNYVQYNNSGVFGGTSGLQISGGTLPIAYTSSTGTVNVLGLQMGGARTAGNNWGMYWADSAGETNAALWASYTGGNNAAALVFGTNAGTGGASGIASTTEQMRITATGLLQFNSGYGSSAAAYGCRAWVNFNGTGTVAIRASGNVSSISDNGTGNYTVNFSTAMPDANYSTVMSSTAGADEEQRVKILAANSSSAPTTYTASAVRIAGYTSTDYNVVTVAVFR